jgi:membrane protein
MTTTLRKIHSALYRAIVVTNTRYRDDVLSLQAMSLTYSTLLSLVPFLAVMFSVLKAFGVQNALEPFLARALQPLGADAAEVTNRIISFVDNLQVGILGAAGTAMLFYTVVTLVAKIEDALNRIWRLPRSRSWTERITAYLSVVLVGAGHGLYRFDSYRLGAKLLAGGAPRSDRLRELCLYPGDQRHAVRPVLRDVHVSL